MSRIDNDVYVLTLRGSVKVLNSNPVEMPGDFPTQLTVQQLEIDFFPAKRCPPLKLLVAYLPDDRMPGARQEAAGEVIGQHVRRNDVGIAVVNIGSNNYVLPALHKVVPIPHLRPLCQQYVLEDGTVICEKLQYVVWGRK